MSQNRNETLRRLPWLLGIVCALASSGCHAPPAEAANPTASAGVRRTLVGHEPAHEAGWETRLYLVEYPPGAAAPAHIHPVVGVGWVIDGEFESAFGDEPAVKVQAGHGFVDKAGVHTLFRNSSPDRPLRFLIAYTIRTDEPQFRPMP